MSLGSSGRYASSRSRSHLNVGGNWIQHRPQAPRSTQRFERFQKQLGETLRILHLHDVRQVLVRLAGESEAVGRRVHPAFEHFRRRQTAESIVRLDAVQARRVVFEELLRRHILRIEIRLPRRIREAGSARETANLSRAAGAESRRGAAGPKNESSISTLASLRIASTAWRAISGLQLGVDVGLHFGQRLDCVRLHPDDVVAEGRFDGLGDLANFRCERRLLERQAPSCRS